MSAPAAAPLPPPPVQMLTVAAAVPPPAPILPGMPHSKTTPAKKHDGGGAASRSAERPTKKHRDQPVPVDSGERRKDGRPLMKNVGYWERTSAGRVWVSATEVRRRNDAAFGYGFSPQSKPPPPSLPTPPQQGSSDGSPSKPPPPSLPATKPRAAPANPKPKAKTKAKPKPLPRPQQAQPPPQQQRQEQQRREPPPLAGAAGEAKPEEVLAAFRAAPGQAPSLDHGNSEAGGGGSVHGSRRNRQPTRKILESEEIW